MKLFGKKKKDEETTEEEEKTKNKKRSKRGRKKKEEKKPWTKKERFLVLSVLAFTVISSAILALTAREGKLPGLPRIKKPTINLFKKETIVLEGEGSMNNTQKEKIIEAEEEFKNITGDLSGVYGFYVYDINRSYSYGVNRKEEFYAASLIKLPVMAAIYKKAEEGNLNLESVYALKDEDKVKGAGTLYYQPAGTKVTYRELIELMAQQSDNTAFNVARDILGDDEIKSEINNIGMHDTSLDENITTPEDIGIYFEKLYKDEIISEEHTKELLDFLTDTSFEAWIPKGILNDIRVAHKYGREVHVVNDAGVVYSDKPYILVILSKGVVEQEADKVFPDLSSMIYSYQEKI